MKPTTGGGARSAHPELDALAREAAEMLRAPIALVSLVDAVGQRFPGLHGLGGWAGAARATPLSHSICRHVVRIGAPLAIGDSRRHPLTADNGAVIELGVVAYLGAPLRDASGAIAGAFCVIDVRPRSWRARSRQALAEFALLAEAELGFAPAQAERSAARARLERSQA